MFSADALLIAGTIIICCIAVGWLLIEGRKPEVA